MATPKTLAEKTAIYQNDSFSIWLQKTNIVAKEQGNLNDLEALVLDAIDDSEDTLNLVNAINWVYTESLKEARNILIKAIGMS
jgi:hypothetical protein